MSSLRKMSLLDCDQSDSDMNDVCNFLHGDHMGSRSVMEEFLGDQVSELAEDLFSTHVNIIKLKEMLIVRIKRDSLITELKNQIDTFKNIVDTSKNLVDTLKNQVDTLKKQHDNFTLNCQEMITSVKQDLNVDSMKSEK